ncbi:MAG: Calx-beta domain-containing protein, partial [Pseudohongiellaceae bacterium]
VGASFAIGTINNDDVAFISVDNASADENENLEFTVTLAPVSYLTVVVSYATTDGTAEEGKDYTRISNGMLTFMPDASSGTITVFITDDLITEGSEDLTLTLSGATHASIVSGSTSVTGTINDNEMPTLSISASAGSVTEGADAVFIITSTHRPMSDTTIGVMGSQTGTFVANALPTMVTLVADETSATLSIATTEDDIDEADGSLTLQFDSTKIPGSYTVTSLSVATVTIEDDDGPEISAADVTADESAERLVFTVALNATPTEQTEVMWETANDTTGTSPATAGTDYTAARGKLTFAADTTTLDLNVTVSITNDDEVEPLETLLLTLSAPTNEATFAAGASSVTVTGTITSDDVTFVSVDNADANENENLVFPVTLSPISYQTVVVSYSTTDGTAKEGSDYAISNGMLTFMPGANSGTIIVTVINDDITEDSEDLTLTLSDATHATIFAGSTSVTGTINDDEMPELSIRASASSVTEGADAVFIIASGNSPMDDTVIGVATTDTGGFAASNTLPASVTLIAGQTTATLSIATTGDRVDEPDGSLAMQLNISDRLPNYRVDSAAASATVTIKDDDGPAILVADAGADEQDGQLVFTVALDLMPVEETEVDWTTADDTTGISPATAGTDYTVAGGKLTFAAGTTTLSLSVTINIADDGDVEPDETFLLTLSAPTNEATFAAGASSVTVTGTITSDDVTFVSVDNDSADENENLEFTVTLAPVSYLTVVVTYATMDGTAKEGSDYAISDGMLTFMPDASSRTITVFVTDDLITEDDEDLTLTLSDAVNATIVSGTTSVTGTITDNEMPGLSIRASASTVTEGTPAVFFITSTRRPMSDTTIGVMGSQTDAFIANALPTTVTLAARETTATLTVATDDDMTDEADGSLTLQFDSTNIPASYTVTSLSVATVTIEDDDGPEISVADVTADESAERLVFTVELNATPTEQTEVSWATADDATLGAMQATAGADPPVPGTDTDYIANSGTLTFTAGTAMLDMSVTVNIVDDDKVEPAETFLLTLSAPTNEATFAAGAS